MSELVSHIAPLALGAAVSPTVLTMSVLILSREHGRSRLAVFTAANVLVLVAIGVAGIVAFKGTIGEAGEPTTKAAQAAVDTALGLILLIFGVRAMLRPAPERSREQSPDDGDARLGRYFMLGVVMMLSNFTTLALFLPADKEIAIADVPVAGKALVLAGLTVVSTMTAWLPLGLVTIAPRASRPMLESIDHFTTVHRKAITVVVCILFGVYLLAKGIAGGG